MYRLIYCPECDAARITRANKWFRCLHCGYRTTMNRVLPKLRSMSPHSEINRKKLRKKG